MRYIKLLYFVIVLLGLVSSSSVWAHGHSHWSIGLGYYGPGFYGGYGYGGYGYGGYGYRGYGYGGYGWGYPSYYYPPAYYYPPQTVIVPTTPPVYIQQQQAQPAQPQTNYWYYCQNPDGYYPYVKRCPGGWLQVAPQPPGQ